jgi:hypothetical protein
MNLTSKILSVALLAGIASASALRAEEINTVQSMKPLQGILIEVGAKHGVGYFYSEANHCKLVLTLADDPNTEDDLSFTAIRHEATVFAGNSTRYNSPDGKSLEFTCATDAQKMTVRQVERVVAGAGR